MGNNTYHRQLKDESLRTKGKEKGLKKQIYVLNGGSGTSEKINYGNMANKIGQAEEPIYHDQRNKMIHEINKKVPIDISIRGDSLSVNNSYVSNLKQDTIIDKLNNSNIKYNKIHEDITLNNIKVKSGSLIYQIKGVEGSDAYVIINDKNGTLETKTIIADKDKLNSTTINQINKNVNNLMRTLDVSVEENQQFNYDNLVNVLESKRSNSSEYKKLEKLINEGFSGVNDNVANVGTKIDGLRNYLEKDFSKVINNAMADVGDKAYNISKKNQEEILKGMDELQKSYNKNSQEIINYMAEANENIDLKFNELTANISKITTKTDMKAQINNLSTMISSESQIDAEFKESVLNSLNQLSKDVSKKSGSVISAREKLLAVAAASSVVLGVGALGLTSITPIAGAYAIAEAATGLTSFPNVPVWGAALAAGGGVKLLFEHLNEKKEGRKDALSGLVSNLRNKYGNK